jgi:hypothetical protein
MAGTPTFVDRVMDEVDAEPAAGPGRALDQAIRERSVRDAGDSVLVAWRLAGLRAMPGLVRLQAAAFVLVVASALAAGSALAAVTTVRTVAPIVLGVADRPADDARAVPVATIAPAAPQPPTVRTSGNDLRPVPPMPLVVPRAEVPAPTARPDGKTPSVKHDDADHPAERPQREPDPGSEDAHGGGGTAEDTEHGDSDRADDTDPGDDHHDGSETDGTPRPGGDDDGATGEDHHDGSSADPSDGHDDGGESEDGGSDDGGGGD